MDIDQYKRLTKKEPPKSKPRNTPLPKAKKNYLEAEEKLTEQLEKLGIKFEKKFQFKSTKHWRFDFHIIGKQLLVEISGGSWSGGRKGKLKNKAWSVDRYDVAEELGYSVVRLESSSTYKINESGPLQVESSFAAQWLKSLKRQAQDGTNQTISTNGLD